MSGPKAAWRSVTDSMASLAMISASAAIIWAIFFRPGGNRSERRDIPVPLRPIAVSGSPSKGSDLAPVALIEYSDFQCPYCGRFAREVLPRIEETYVKRGLVMVVFRHSPGPSHQYAEKAAEAAECARQAGRFWEMHDLNFQNQQALNEEALVERAVNTGIGRGVFLPCLANGGKERVRQDLEEGRKLGIQGTPAFIVGKIGRNREVNAVATLSGAQPFEKFASILEKALAGR